MIREGPANQIITKSGKPKPRERYLFLFSDMLLLSDEMLVRKLKKMQGTINYNTKCMINISPALKLIDIDERKFQLLCPQDGVDCVLEMEPKDKSLWFADFQKCLS